MWQFTRSTGRRYMRIDNILDERLDPFIASIAAARLLKNNYSVTGTWPLALTAYNHGAAGMRRAAKQVGSTDIVKVLRHYKSRSFGFASRNFYPSFLAALEIDQNPKKYFNNIKLDPPANVKFVKLPAYVSADAIIKVLKIDRRQLMDMNPALRIAVWNTDKYIPKKYKLRLDRAIVANTHLATKKITHIASKYQFAQQKSDRFHRVKKGQSLSIIAARYRIKVRDLVAANNMRNKHHIQVGQLLILPTKARKTKSKKKQASRQVNKKNKRQTQSKALPKNGIYIVKSGDTMHIIARKYSLKVNDILALNRLKSKHKIYPGQALILVKKVS
jgi:membrane-bound lytic murein transglycosylase D